MSKECLRPKAKRQTPAAVSFGHLELIIPWSLLEHWSLVILACSQQALRLVQRLLVFALRVRVGDDAAADRELHPAAARGERADQDARVHRAVEADEAERAAVRSPDRGLQLRDDLHSSHFRGPGHRPAG